LEALPFLGAVAVALGVGVVVRARRTRRPAFSRFVGGLAIAMGLMLIVLPLLRRV